MSIMSRKYGRRAGHPDYAAVYKRHKSRTPGGLKKEDIIRRVVKGSNPPRYRYVSRARHELAMARGIPPEFHAMKFTKR